MKTNLFLSREDNDILLSYAPELLKRLIRLDFAWHLRGVEFQGVSIEDRQEVEAVLIAYDGV